MLLVRAILILAVTQWGSMPTQLLCVSEDHPRHLHSNHKSDCHSNEEETEGNSPHQNDSENDAASHSGQGCIGHQHCVDIALSFEMEQGSGFCRLAFDVPRQVVSNETPVCACLVPSPMLQHVFSGNSVKNLPLRI